MTTLDAKAIKAAARKITGGSTFDADERIGIAIDVVRTYLAKASPALSSLPAQAVARWQPMISEVNGSPFPFMARSGEGEWVRFSDLAPSRPAAVGEGVTEALARVRAANPNLFLRIQDEEDGGAKATAVLDDGAVVTRTGDGWAGALVALESALVHRDQVTL